ncbi:hypothetical protein B0T14DRAFT_434147 [Immersiella caudata]|uniref:Zn(2)-C6 fungal-type domain-containing protein n=1 Tax=Immersiella caudata TaxID=314043 RepID=A0AA39WLN8_9PEZI|nr:hypothetical protein B0T14DRAFT_434147 [Immersiella caudata]
MEREPGNARTRPKSRTGCVNCKRRKLKASKPLSHLQGCKKAALKCEYHVRPFDETSPSPTPSPCPQPSSYLLDMELMHHYSSVVCSTLTCDSDIRPVFQTLMVRAALKCDYLLKTVLAVASLHMARSQPEKSDAYFATALDYYQTALGAANSSLANLKEGGEPEEAVSLWFFSSLTIVFVLGSPPQDARPNDPLFAATLFPDWLFLIRGTKSIRPMIRADVMAAVTIAYRARWEAMHPGKFQPSREQDAMEELETLLRENLHDSDEHKETLTVYLKAISMLKGIFHSIAVHGAEHLDICDLFMWIHEVNDDFIPLLEIPTREALAVFAYFCVLLKKAEFHCWLEGWGDLLIQRVKELVDGEHMGWIRWAVEEIEGMGVKTGTAWR